MELTEQISSAVNNSVQPIKEEMAVQTEILHRVEQNVIKTNGRVTELERWRIESDSESRTRKEILQTNRSNYTGPIVSGIVVGVILIVVELALNKM